MVSFLTKSLIYKIKPFILLTKRSEKRNNGKLKI